MQINNFNVAQGATVNMISDSTVTINQNEVPRIEQISDTTEITGGDFIEEAKAIDPIEEEFNRLLEHGQEFFEDAVEEGFMTKTEDGYVWNLSKTLLAYFIGKIYCNDCVTKDKYGNTWSGEEGFPEKFVEKLFRMKDVGALRRNKFTGKSTPPKGYEKIDALF